LRAFSATTDFYGYRGSAATAALSTLFGSASGSPAVPLPSHLTAANVSCQASRRCNGLLQLSALTIINTWTATAPRQLQCLYTYRLCSISVTMGGLGSRGITHPSLSLRPWCSASYVLGSGFWTCSPGRVSSDISPDNHCL